MIKNIKKHINPYIRIAVAVKHKDIIKLKWYQEERIYHQIRIELLGTTIIFLN